MPENQPEQSQIIVLHVDDTQTGERLDRFLASSPESETLSLSRERLKSLIQQGYVQVNQRPVTKPSLVLSESDTVELNVPPSEPLNLVAEAIPLEIVYEDNALLVVNKPRGMLTHPAGKYQTGTLVNALLHHCRDSNGQSTLSGINGVIRPGIVHRLDKDTSGLLVVAKTDAAHASLAKQLQPKHVTNEVGKRMRREYMALVQGVPKQTTGVIDAPIGRDPKHREKMRITSGNDGRFARTHWETVDVIGYQYSLLRLSLDTGRTHQIRVHLAHIGHPVAGDVLYGTGLEKSLKLKPVGQRLQAISLTFEHPEDDRAVTFSVPLEPLIQSDWEDLQAL